MKTSSPPAVNLLCLPCAGASANMYLRWRQRLPAWIRLVPVELPGRGSRLAEPFVNNFEQLVARLCDEQTSAMQGSWALFGHSMGGLLAYGMVRHLRERGLSLPRMLLVSASPAPSRRDPERFAGKDNDSALIDDLREQGGTPEELFACPELLRMTLDALAADYCVCESFQYRGACALPIPVHALAGRKDSISAAQMEGWRDETTAAFALDWFDGGHFYIRDHESRVLDIIERGLTLPEPRRPAVAACSTATSTAATSGTPDNTASATAIPAWWDGVPA